MSDTAIVELKAMMRREATYLHRLLGIFVTVMVVLAKLLDQGNWIFMMY